MGITSLPKLASLDLSESLTNLMLFYLESLASLDLSKNFELRDLDINDLPELDSLDLSNNSELGVLRLNNLPKLHSLNLSNNFEFTWFEITDSPALDTLVLSGIIKTLNLVNLESLESLDLSECLGLINLYIWNLPKFNSLTLPDELDFLSTVHLYKNQLGIVMLIEILEKLPDRIGINYQECKIYDNPGLVGLTDPDLSLYNTAKAQAEANGWSVEDRL